jgi:hypothetical protein
MSSADKCETCGHTEWHHGTTPPGCRIQFPELCSCTAYVAPLPEPDEHDWIDDPATSSAEKWDRFMSMGPEPTTGPMTSGASSTKTYTFTATPAGEPDCTHENGQHQAPGSTIWTCLRCGAALWDDAQDAFEAMQKRNTPPGRVEADAAARAAAEAQAETAWQEWCLNELGMNHPGPISYEFRAGFAAGLAGQDKQ